MWKGSYKVINYSGTLSNSWHMSYDTRDYISFEVMFNVQMALAGIYPHLTLQHKDILIGLFLSHLTTLYKEVVICSAVKWEDDLWNLCGLNAVVALTCLKKMSKIAENLNHEIWTRELSIKKKDLLHVAV